MAVLKLTIPQDWNDLTKRNIKFISKLWFDWTSNIEEYKQLEHANKTKEAKALNFKILKQCTKLFMNLTNVDRWWRWRLQYLFWKQTDTQLNQCIKDLLFIREDINLTKNNFPYLCLLTQKWYAPINGFSDFKAAEYAFADSCFLRYWETKEISHLNNLISILYRKKEKNNNPSSLDYTGSFREKFNRYNIEARSKKLWCISLATKTAILLWYLGSRKAYQKKFPLIFTNSVKNKANKYGWISVFRELAGKDVVKIPLIEKQDLTLLLSSLDMDISESLIASRK